MSVCGGVSDECGGCKKVLEEVEEMLEEVWESLGEGMEKCVGVWERGGEEWRELRGRGGVSSECKGVKKC